MENKSKIRKTAQFRFVHYLLLTMKRSGCSQVLWKIILASNFISPSLSGLLRATVRFRVFQLELWAVAADPFYYFTLTCPEVLLPSMIVVFKAGTVLCFVLGFWRMKWAPFDHGNNGWECCTEKVFPFSFAHFLGNHFLAIVKS